MELNNAVEILKAYKERKTDLMDIRVIFEAIDIVLDKLEITIAMKEVAFEDGYRKGKHSGTKEGFYSGVAMGTQQRKYIDEKTIKIKDEYLKLIYNLLIDYDGCKTVKSLKELIDETREYIHKALKNDDKSVITVNSKKKFNILGEEVEDGTRESN